MEKEYYTIDNYERLKLELKELEERKVELEKEYRTAADSYYVFYQKTFDRLCSKRDHLIEQNDQFLNSKEQELFSRLFNIGCIIGISVAITLGGIGIHERVVNALPDWPFASLLFSGVLGGFSIFCGFAKSHNKIWNRKKTKYKLFPEYLQRISRIEALTKEIKEKEKEKEMLYEKSSASFDNITSINSDIIKKKQEIINFEREYLSINLTQEDKEQTSHKTRVLEP